jgi:thioredoxin reductase
MVEQIDRYSSLRGKHVVVVGAGIAGLTAAAALATLHARVKIYEKQGILSRYKLATHRDIHPNLINWPFRSLRSVTSLPFLNWGAGTAKSVADQILMQWDAYYAKYIPVISGKVASVEDRDKYVDIRLDNGIVERADLVLLTPGFDDELDRDRGVMDTFGDGRDTNDKTGYWQPFLPNSHVCISGSGDGGLIDVGYHLFGSFAVKFSQKLAYAVDTLPLKYAVQDIEERARSLASGPNSAESFRLLE